MHIVVCVKQVLDPELPASKFRLDSHIREVIPPEGIPLVINPFDAQAIEVALRLKEANGAKITALSVGDESAVDIVRHALSMGVDEGILVVRHLKDIDGFATAYILSQAIKKIGNYDCILCGREAADWDRQIVGSIIAEDLGVNLVTLAKDVKVVEGKLRVQRVIENGYQIFETVTPALITVSNEVGQPRLPSGYGIISAARKQILLWREKDIEVDSHKIEGLLERSKLVNIFTPTYERKCVIISGESLAEAAAKLAVKLMTEHN